MRIVFPAVGITPGVNGQGIGQPFVSGQVLAERVGQCDLVFRLEVTWKCEVRAQIQAAVCSLEQVRCIPVVARIVLRP